MATTTEDTASTVVVGDLVRIATGESRPITDVDAAGAYLCPWCGNAVFPRDPAWAARQCRDPACLAFPGLSVEYTRAEQARRQALQREEEDRKRRLQAMVRIDAEFKRADAARWAEVAAEADKRGACPVCLGRSQWRYGTPKYVKHRSADYHDRDR